MKESIVKIGHRISNKTTDACVLTAVINGDIALATIPGEIFVQHQIDLRAQSPLPNTFLLGVARAMKTSPRTRLAALRYAQWLAAFVSKSPTGKSRFLLSFHLWLIAFPGASHACHCS